MQVNGSTSLTPTGAANNKNGANCTNSTTATNGWGNPAFWTSTTTNGLGWDNTIWDFSGVGATSYPKLR